MTTRRTFLRGLTTLLAMPAIVKVGSIMPVRAAPVAMPVWGPTDADVPINLVGARETRLVFEVWTRDFEGRQFRYVSDETGQIILPARQVVERTAVAFASPSLATGFYPRP